MATCKCGKCRAQSVETLVFRHRREVIFNPLLNLAVSGVFSPVKLFHLFVVASICPMLTLTKTTMSTTNAFKYIWASPASAIGICAACFAGLVGAKVKRVSGVLEVSLAPRRAVLCKAVACLPFAAITLGHVVIACSAQEQAAHREHERVHVAQYELWGPVFLLAYPLDSLYQLLNGRRPYLDNRFELAARAACRGAH